MRSATNIAMTTDVAVTLAPQLARVQWTWQRTELQEALDRLGATEIERANDGTTSRITYQLFGHLCDVYFSQANGEQVEFTIARDDNAEELSDVGYEDKVDEFYDLFVAAADALEVVLGGADFRNGAAATGFPDDQDAEWVALWRLPLARLMLQQRHEDRELPFRLCLVVAPP